MLVWRWLDGLTRVTRTDGDGLDLDTVLDRRAVGVVRLLVAQHTLAAESVDKGRSSCKGIGVSRRDSEIEWTRGGRVGGDSNVPVPDAPQTIKQNWIPFFTFFFLRIIF